MWGGQRWALCELGARQRSPGVGGDSWAASLCVTPRHPMSPHTAQGAPWRRTLRASSCPSLSAAFCPYFQGRCRGDWIAVCSFFLLPACLDSCLQAGGVCVHLCFVENWQGGMGSHTACGSALCCAVWAAGWVCSEGFSCQSGEGWKSCENRRSRGRVRLVPVCRK